MRRSWIVPLTALLAACAAPQGGGGERLTSPHLPNNRGQCEGWDWFQAGRTEGIRGAPLEVISLYEKYCNPHGVTPDREAFARGHRLGANL